MGSAAEAMVEALQVIDREAGRFFVVEWAAGLELMSRLGQSRRPPDHAGKRDARAQFLQPLGGKAHCVIFRSESADSRDSPLAQISDSLAASPDARDIPEQGKNRG